jgi:hypothetical protein
MKKLSLFLLITIISTIFSAEPNAQKVLKFESFEDYRCKKDQSEIYYILVFYAEASGFETNPETLSLYLTKPDYIEAKCEFHVWSKKAVLKFIIDAKNFPILDGFQLPAEFTKYNDIQIEGWKDVYNGEFIQDKCHPDYKYNFTTQNGFEPIYNPEGKTIEFNGTFDGESRYILDIPILVENKLNYMKACSIERQLYSNETRLVCSINVGDKKARLFPTISEGVLLNIDYSINGVSILVQNIWLFMILLIILF